MKKILFVITLITFGSAYAATMCVHTDSYIATLVRSRNGVSVDVTDINTSGPGYFRVTFDYKTSNLNTPYIDGISLCVDDITGIGVVGNDDAENMLTNDAVLASKTGKKCWCGMLMPLVAGWVAGPEYSYDSECAANCTTVCATSVRDDPSFRTSLFESFE